MAESVDAATRNRRNRDGASTNAWTVTGGPGSPEQCPGMWSVGK